MMEAALTRQAPQTLFLDSFDGGSSTSTSNQINLSFATPLTKEPSDLVYVTLGSFTSFNTFPSISQNQGNNVCKILNVMYNAVTGVYDYSRVKRVIIPDDHYDVNTLVAYLNKNGNYQETVTFTGATPWTTTVGGASILYLGFGFDGTNNIVGTTPILGFAVTPDNSRIVIQPPVTAAENAYSKVYNTGYSITNDPYVYAGLYLIVDNETSGFMESIGYSNKFTASPQITPSYSGYGYNFSTSVTPTTTSFTLIIGQQVIALSGPWMLYFTIDNMSTNSRCNDNLMDQLNIVDTIPVEAYYGGMISYQASLPKYQLVGDLNTVTLTVSIYDQNRKLVDFRGTQWKASLHFITKTNARDLMDMQQNNQSKSITYTPDLPPTLSNSKKRENPFGGSLDDPLHTRRRL